MQNQNTCKAWAEVFEIFSKYEVDASVAVGHDIIYAGPEPEDVSDDDMKRLEELGWFIDAEFGCLARFV